jgi:probable rRNA maturation factor
MSWEINFFSENISYVVRKKGALRKWISGAIEREGKVAGDLNFILCDDDYLAELNFKYLRHKTLTDILTFPLDDENGSICGDIFISLPRVRENAQKFNQRLEIELHRVMIHGVLHLIGYNDSSKTEKDEMHHKEDFYLNLLQAI